MPAQKDLPAPVRIPTRTLLRSTASSAESKSEIIGGEMALRFSGRFSVMVAISPVMSSNSVEYMGRSQFLFACPFNLQVRHVHILREAQRSCPEPWSAGLR